MPRSSGVYTAPSGTLATTATPISSTAYNAFVNDLVADANAARPITAGGTGATTGADALVAFGVNATAAELNILDGATVTTAELNILDGVTATAAELNILDGVTATADEINRASNFGLIAQGSLSGSSLIVEIPSDFEGVEITVWRYTPSTNGTILKLTIGSGPIATPVWGVLHFQQGMVQVSTTPSYYNNINQSSIDLSQPQSSAAGGYGRAILDGFQTTGAVRGTVSRVGTDSVAVNRASHDLVGEDTAVTHSLIRLSVSAGTMSGSYRIAGHRKP